MIDFLGIIAAIITLIAALFGIIPPILSSGGRNGKTDRAISGALEGLMPILVMGGFLGLFFFYMYGMFGLQDFMSNRNDRKEEKIEIRGINDSDFNLVLNAELISNYSERNDALVEIIDFSLSKSNPSLATLAASKISNYSLKNEKLQEIQQHIIRRNSAHIEVAP